jgi:hypothetical protein
VVTIPLPIPLTDEPNIAVGRPPDKNIIDPDVITLAPQGKVTISPTLAVKDPPENSIIFPVVIIPVAGHAGLGGQGHMPTTISPTLDLNILILF